MANADAEQEHEKSIIAFAESSATINAIQERSGFLSFQGPVGTLIVAGFEPTNTLSRILQQKTALDSFIKQSPGNGPHPCCS